MSSYYGSPAKRQATPFTNWTDYLTQVSDLFPCDDSHKKNSIRLVERIPSMQISKVVTGKEMPTEIWSTSVPDPPSTAPATQIEQATFELSWKTNVAVEKIPTKKKTASALWMLLPVL